MTDLNEAVLQRFLEALYSSEPVENMNPETLELLISCLCMMIRVQNEELHLYEMTLALLRGREESAQIAVNVLDQALKKMTTQQRDVNAEVAMRHVLAYREEVELSATNLDEMKAACALAIKLTRKLLEARNNHAKSSAEKCAA